MKMEIKFETVIKAKSNTDKFAWEDVRDRIIRHFSVWMPDTIKPAETPQDMKMGCGCTATGTIGAYGDGIEVLFSAKTEMVELKEGADG